MSTDARFDEFIHAPLRLRICGLLRAGKGVDFGVLRDTLGITDANLSKHLKLLADAGAITMDKASSVARTDARRVAWVALTPRGADAFDAHVEALRAITRGE